MIQYDQLKVSDGTGIKYSIEELLHRISRVEEHVGLKSPDQLSDESLQPSGEIVITPDVPEEQS